MPVGTAEGPAAAARLRRTAKRRRAPAAMAGAQADSVRADPAAPALAGLSAGTEDQEAFCAVPAEPVEPEVRASCPGEPAGKVARVARRALRRSAGRADPVARAGSAQMATPCGPAGTAAREAAVGTESKRVVPAGVAASAVREVLLSHWARTAASVVRVDAEGLLSKGPAVVAAPGATEVPGVPEVTVRTARQTGALRAMEAMAASGAWAVAAGWADPDEPRATAAQVASAALLGRPAMAASDRRERTHHRREARADMAARRAHQDRVVWAAGQAARAQAARPEPMAPAVAPSRRAVTEETAGRRTWLPGGAVAAGVTAGRSATEAMVASVVPSGAPEGTAGMVVLWRATAAMAARVVRVSRAVRVRMARTVRHPAPMVGTAPTADRGAGAAPAAMVATPQPATEAMVVTVEQVAVAERAAMEATVPTATCRIPMAAGVATAARPGVADRPERQAHPVKALSTVRRARGAPYR